MPNLPTLGGLQELKRCLETAVRLTTDLDANRSLVRLAADDPERWNLLLDSLSAAMEPSDQGSVQQVLAALNVALEC